nr:hypothetical protein [Tanacetum cinerariifolium]
MGKKGTCVNIRGRKLKSINDSAGIVIVVRRSSVDGASDGTIIREPAYIGSVPHPDMPIIQSAFISKPVSYTRAACASSAVPKKGKANFRPLEYENVCDGVDLTIPIKVVEAVNTRFENTLFGYIIGKRVALPVVEYYVYNNWGKGEDVLQNGSWMIRNSPLILENWTMNTRLFKKDLTRIPVFACCLIEVRIDAALKDNVTMGIPLPDDDLSKKLPATKGGLHVPTSKPSVPTSNPYDVLDDMRSEEEAEVVYDETVILKVTRTGVSPSMALDGYNT